MERLFRYYVGIDGGKHNGFAIWDKEEQKVIDIQSYTFFQLLERLDTLDADNTLVYLEYPNANKTTFYRERMTKPVLDKRAQDVGKVKCVTDLIKDYLEIIGVECKLIKPLSPNKWKNDTEYFAKLTGITDRTNPHKRDAVMLVYNIK